MNINKNKHVKSSPLWTEYNEKTISSMDYINKKFNNLSLSEDNCLVEKWIIISNYIKNYPSIFKQFLLQNQSSVNIYNSKTIEDYISNFFKYIENYLKFEQEKVIWIKWNMLYKEALIRFNINNNLEKNINHINFLELCENAKLTFRLFKIVFKNLLIKIKNWEIKWNIWINIEISDLMNEDFITFINENSNKYWIELKKSWIILEILENQKKPKGLEFTNQIIKLKKMWFIIWYDDELSKETHSNKTPIELITELIQLSKKESPHIIKIDKEFIWEISNANKSTWWQIELPFLKKIIQNCNSHWTKIVAEWIEDEYMIDFCINTLGIEYFQWYFFKKIENISNLPNLIKNLENNKNNKENEKEALLQKLAIR